MLLQSLKLLLVLSLLAVSRPALAQRPLDDLPSPVDGGRRYSEILVPGNGMGFVGLATIYAGQPVIFYDGVWIGKIGGLESPAFRFVRAHEYAHHRRRHALEQYSTPPMFLPFLANRTELEADCWAVEQLERDGDYEAIREGRRIYERVLTLADTPDGRPGSLARLRNIDACQDGGGRSPEPRPAMGSRCQTMVGICGPFPGVLLPLGSPCHCYFDQGRVVP